MDDVTLRALLVVALLAAGGVVGVRYAHERFAAERASYTTTATNACLVAVPGVRVSPATPGGSAPGLVVSTATNAAGVWFYDSPADAAYAKTLLDEEIQHQGRDSTGLVDQQANAVVSWRGVPLPTDRDSILDCLE